ncbi:MAG TPA: phenylalanine--tRNA ligase subunit beta [Phycisphaerae bacterium]|nr:phenylalanine--tRNA ligase subunit beta [Phycisphaerae bacterium]
MFVSLTWLRDFVDLPADVDPRALAERFTVTSAEVEGVEQITCDARGLVAGGILSVKPIPGGNLFVVRVDIGSARIDSVTVAEGLAVGQCVIYAPPGSLLPGIGEVGERKVSGRPSAGMVVPGDALNLPTIGQRAIWLPPDTKPGEPIDIALFNDWIIEIDNKSITNRPDLWGHYGIAREVAAILRKPLKPYPVTPIKEIDAPAAPVVPIVIDDPVMCPRYTALRFKQVRSRPSPLWMQARLAHVGLRPIDLLVDLTNYIMVELGQPMHAFDGTHIERIEVAVANPGEKFTTLDGVQRTMPEGALMIQADRRSVALAGIMGGVNTEITAKTESLLLESANFEPATIRRCATALGHRTDASARFEKSLDPNHTVLAIQRFVHLARPELPSMELTSRISDCFPNPPKPTVIDVDPAFVSRYVGRPVSVETIRGILEPLEFKVAPVGDMSLSQNQCGTGVSPVESSGVGTGSKLKVTVPTFRATKDVTIEADVIEETARFIGYRTIEPVPPVITVRYAEPEPIVLLEKNSLRLLCTGLTYAEIHRHIWFEAEWIKRLGFDPGRPIALRNPAAAGQEQLRTTLVPGLLDAVDLNRRHTPRFELLELGSVFLPCPTGDKEHRRIGLAVVAPGRKSTHEDELVRRLKTDLDTWARQILRASLSFAAGTPSYPWEHDAKSAEVLWDGLTIGRLTIVPNALKRVIDEHLAAWSIALAEIDLTTVLTGRPTHRKLAPVPTCPRIELDFSVLVNASQRYVDLEKTLAAYDHPLLRRLSFVDSFEGGSIPAGRRSFTFRAVIGAADRTLTETDIQSFRADFLAMAERSGMSLRA